MLNYFTTHKNDFTEFIIGLPSATKAKKGVNIMHMGVGLYGSIG